MFRGTLHGLDDTNMYCTKIERLIIAHRVHAGYKYRKIYIQELCRDTSELVCTICRLGLFIYFHTIHSWRRPCSFFDNAPIVLISTVIHKYLNSTYTPTKTRILRLGTPTPQIPGPVIVQRECFGLGLEPGLVLGPWLASAVAKPR